MTNSLLQSKLLRRTAKLLAVLTVLVLIFSPTFNILQPVTIVHALTTGCIDDGGNPVAPVNGACPAGTDSVNNGIGSQGTTPSGTTSAATSDAGFCNSADTCISSVVYVFTVGLMSIFAYVGGYIFDFAVQLSLNSIAYSLNFLTSGWTAVRDIANMAFIFILIYIAFTILFKAETAGTMKLLAGVVVMALLINFSFFITRVVIDAGNILAVQFYNAIPAPTLGQSANNSVLASASNLISANSNTKDLTAGLMGVVQVQNILNNQSFQNFTTNNTGFTGFLVKVIVEIIVYIAVGAMLAILAAVFLTVGFKFLIRTIILWFVIIAAPFAFVARAMSNSKQARSLYTLWQSLLLKFSFYPAIFLFMFLIITYIAGAIGGGQGLVPSIFSDLATGTSAGTPAIQVLGAAIANVGIRLGLVVIMLYYGLRVCDFIVTEGTGAANNLAGLVGRRTGDIVYGLPAFAQRQTIGRGAGAIANATAQRANTSSNRLSQGLWRGVSRAGNYVAGASQDTRNIPGYRRVTALTDLNVTKQPIPGLDIGQGGRGRLPTPPAAPGTLAQTRQTTVPRAANDNNPNGQLSSANTGAPVLRPISKPSQPNPRPITPSTPTRIMPAIAGIGTTPALKPRTELNTHIESGSDEKKVQLMREQLRATRQNTEVLREVKSELRESARETAGSGINHHLAERVAEMRNTAPTKIILSGGESVPPHPIEPPPLKLKEDYNDKAA